MRPSYNVTYGVKQKRMSDTEKKHLTIALGALTLAFAISFAGGINRVTLSIGFLILIVISFVAVGTAFLFHELAHRKLARDFGCWAEFRMWKMGLLMALLFSTFGFVFAAPGAVMIRGEVNKEQNGKISAAGPATNWLVGSGFLALGYGLNITGLPFGFIMGFISFVNLFIGGFNLLPFGPLDGGKIFSWSLKNYLILAVLIASTLAAGHFLLPSYPI